jgi:hypothetical protein
MKREEKAILDRATQALRADVPDEESISASAERTAKEVGIEMNRETFDGAIRNCEDVQRLFGSYRASTLPAARKLLVEAHLRDCGHCLRLFNEGREHAVLNWSAPRIATASERRPLAWGWGLATAAVLLATGFFVYRTYWQVPPGVRAEVQSIDGSAYAMNGSADRQIAPGAQLREGDELRTSGDSKAVLRLADGSVVEVNQRSALGVGARGLDMTVTLDRGAVIVQAAHRTSGHLYVRTPDCKVAVTGTVFSVDAGLKGSRVAVLQGSVKVAHAGVQAVLHPGDQMATSDSLAPEPLDQQFAWSPDHEKYVGLMAQLAEVEHRIAQIPFPQPRYSSDLLARVPANTMLYVSIPNLGDFLNEANAVFQDQLKQSPELQEWWTRGHERNPDALNDFIGKIHDVSQYIGDEVVITGLNQGDRSTMAVLADVQRSGLKEELEAQFSGKGLTVLDEAGLAAAGSNSGMGGYALVRDHEVVFANSVATLRQIDAQLDAGASGFADSGFGKQIAAAYGRGAGIILAANLQSMLKTGMAHLPQGARQDHGLENSGLEDLKYLIAEHRETNGMPANHLNLEFTGTRQRVASWMASPAPIGSLEFVSSNAALTLATLTKDPAAIADDLMAMASQSGKKADLSEADAKLNISVRNDLMENLSGDFLFAIDGPVLPTPSWKLVIGVNNPGALENALERMAKASRRQSQGPNAHAVTIESTTVDSRQFYTIRNVSTGAEVADYTFADGFMIVAPSRALVMDALNTQSSGNSLAQSAAFRALLPRDENENYSAVAYQNLSPVLTPLLSQFSGNSADAIRKLAADSRPTVICAWGKDNRIEAASDSRLFGFDFLTMGAILNSRNNGSGPHVMK